MKTAVWSLEVELNPCSEDIRVVRDGLRAFTDSHAGPVNARPFAVFVRDPHGQVLGGLEAELRWTWLFVGQLWLPEVLRGHGLGSALLACAEAFAREHGGTGVYLDTLEFQAVEFYQHRGYSVYGVLEGFPPGSRRFYLQKRLDTIAAAEAP